MRTSRRFPSRPSSNQPAERTTMHRIRRLNGGSRVLVSLAVAGAVFGIAGGVYASVPDASGVIHGCYKKMSPNQGTLRVVDTEKGQACTNSENSLSWNRTGP